jgi:hypothetical protein
MLINKSHGHTFEHVGIYIEQPVFSRQQLYLPHYMPEIQITTEYS